MRILIVEDHFATRRLMSKLLGHLGEVNVAVDGIEAVEAVEAAVCGKEPYDLILMDVMMPRLDGPSAVQKIREIEAQHADLVERPARVLITSSRDDGKALAEAFRSKCDGYLVKPVTTEMIVNELERLSGEEDPGR